MELSGSRILLTGASGGLGHAIARALSARGAQLVLTARRAEVLQALADELGASAAAVDLSDRADVHRLAEQAGEVDILVANAGLPASGRLDSFSADEVDRALDVNLRAPIMLARELSPAMVRRGRGHLVFVSSLSGKAASGSASIYNATKFGLRGFTLALREDLRGAGVGVSGIYPGFIRDAGMFADSDTKLPPGVGTRAPEHVAQAVVRAIEQDRAEIDVAPIALRAGTAFAGVAPETAFRLARLLGSDRVTRDVASGQADKR